MEEVFRKNAIYRKAIVGLLINCGHHFHFECLWKWLEQRTSCPVCRTQVWWSRRHIRAVTYESIVKDKTLTADRFGVYFKCKDLCDTDSVISMEDTAIGRSTSGGFNMFHHSPLHSLAQLPFVSFGDTFDR